MTLRPSPFRARYLDRASGAHSGKGRCTWAFLRREASPRWTCTRWTDLASRSSLLGRRRGGLGRWGVLGRRKSRGYPPTAPLRSAPFPSVRPRPLLASLSFAQTARTGAAWRVRTLRPRPRSEGPRVPAGTAEAPGRAGDGQVGPAGVEGRAGGRGRGRRFRRPPPGCRRRGRRARGTA